MVRIASAAVVFAALIGCHREAQHSDTGLGTPAPRITPSVDTAAPSAGVEGGNLVGNWSDEDGTTAHALLQVGDARPVSIFFPEGCATAWHDGPIAVVGGRIDAPFQVDGADSAQPLRLVGSVHDGVLDGQIGREPVHVVFQGDADVGYRYFAGCH